DAHRVGAVRIDDRAQPRADLTRRRVPARGATVEPRLQHARAITRDLEKPRALRTGVSPARRMLAIGSQPDRGAARIAIDDAPARRLADPAVGSHRPTRA